MCGLSACAAPHLKPSVRPANARLAPPVCTPALAATLPLDPADDYAVVTGVLNQVPARYVLDTGAEVSHVTPWAVGHYHLMTAPGASDEVLGLGGVVRVGSVAAEIGLGGQVTRAVLPVVTLPAGTAGGLPYAGLIGADVLSAFDVEVSMPERVVRLWRVDGCSGDHTGWTGPHWPVPLVRTPGGRLQLTVVLDDTLVTAMLDTAANISVLSAAGAARLGLTPAMLARDPPGRGRGVDGRSMRSHLHGFQVMAVGPELSVHPRLMVSAAALPEADMLLGLDWLRDRRVWISWRTRTMYVQHIGPGDAGRHAR